MHSQQNLKKKKFDRRSPSFLWTYRLRLQGKKTQTQCHNYEDNNVNTCVHCHEKLKSHHLTIVVRARMCVCVCVCVQCSKVNNIILCSEWPHINSNLNRQRTPMVGFETVTVVTSCSLVNMY